MPVPTADANGVLSGRFTIPANVPVGSKTVEFWGSGLSFGAANFIGRGKITQREMRQVRTVTQYLQPAYDAGWDDWTTEPWEPAPTQPEPRSIAWYPHSDGGYGLYYQYLDANGNHVQDPSGFIKGDPCPAFAGDPLAQTFVLPERTIVSGADIFFTAVGTGTGKVIVQIKEVALGLPTKDVLSTTIRAVTTLTAGQWNRIALPPVALEPNREYALVVGCDDAVTAAAIAEVGAWDSTNSRWVTEQPYAIGVLLSSANGSTWTPHQNADLAFRLLSPQYSANTRTVTMAPVTLTDATDLLVTLAAERPSPDVDVTATLNVPGLATPIVTLPNQLVQLATPANGTLNWSINLRGTAQASPRLLRDVQLIAAKRRMTSTYITRAMPAANGSRVRVTYEAKLPGTATVTADVSHDTTNPANWVSLPQIASTPIGDGWFEVTRQLTPYNHTQAQVRLNLSQTAAYRCAVRNLRCLVLAS